jgi:hypothetical protein
VIKRVLRYLKGTAHYSLTLVGSGRDLNLIGWMDSDWAQDLDSRQSVGRFIFDVAGGSVSWLLKKQPTVALSMVEAKYMATLNVIKEVIWLQMLQEDLRFTQTQATKIHADNQGCIALACSPVAHSCTKHINIHHHFIQEWVANEEVDRKFCPTKEMIMDIFMKALPWEVFKRCWVVLGVGDRMQLGESDRN